MKNIKNKQSGVAAVEFALIAIVFFTLLLGIIEFGRVLFTWNSAAEATRYGARVAVVCNINSPAIFSRMQQIMPNIANANVDIDYEPNNCAVGTCERVKVRLQGLTITPIIPLLNVTLSVPPFETSLMRESLSNAIDGYNNPVCL